MFRAVVVPAKRARDFSTWLEANFYLSQFESAVITRKAEETFRDPNAPPLAPLADELLRHADDEKDKRR